MASNGAMTVHPFVEFLPWCVERGKNWICLVDFRDSYITFVVHWSFSRSSCLGGYIGGSSGGLRGGIRFVMASS